jgi:PAS domain S-box-containing protein
MSASSSGEWPPQSGAGAAPEPPEDFLRDAFAHASIGLAVTDLAGRFLQVNPAFCAITGYSEAELLARDFVAITHPDDRADNLHHLRQLLDGAIAHFDVEKRYLTKNGSLVWVLNSIALRRDRGGRPTHLIALVQNISERKQAEAERDRLLAREREARAEAETGVRVLAQAREALRASEEQYRSLADLLPGVVWTARPDGWIDYANRFWLNYTGLTLEQTQGWGWARMVHPDDVDRVRQVWNEALRTGVQVHVEYRLKRVADGAYYWFLARGKSLRNREGHVVKWFGLLTEIEDQKRLEAARADLLVREQQARAEVEAALRARDETLQALRTSEESYRSLAEVMPQCIWTAGADGQTDYVNQHWCDYSGLTVEQSLGAGWATVLHPDDQQRCFEAWTAAVRAGTKFESEYRLRHQSGVYRWFLGRSLPMRDQGGRVVKWLGTATDIEDQKQGAKALERQNALVRLLHDITVSAYEAATVDEAMQIGIDQVCAYTGWPVGHVYVLAEDGAQELLPTSIWHLDHPEKFAEFARVTEMARLPIGVGLPGRVLARKEPAWIMDVTRDENFPRAQAAKGLGVRGAFGFPVLTGGKVAAVLEFFTSEPCEPDPLLLAALEQIGIQLGQVFERKRVEAELHEAKQAAETANQAKSEFLSRMSHELRTPLNAILGFAQLIDMGTPTSLQRKQVEQILKGGRLLLGLINEVLDLARIEAGQVSLAPAPVRVRQLIAEVLDLIRPLAERRAIRLIAPDLPELHVLADDQRLKQVLLNLVSNAVKYNRDKGSVTVRAEAIPSGRVRLLVCDTGPGLAPEQQRRLFNPFDRLGAELTEVEGTGLGLVVSKRLTEAMGGTLEVTSRVGHGSTFVVNLAGVAPGQAGPSVDSQRALLGPLAAGTGGLTVLYIEDNLHNLALVEGILAHRPRVRLLSALQGAQGFGAGPPKAPGLDPPGRSASRHERRRGAAPAAGRSAVESDSGDRAERRCHAAANRTAPRGWRPGISDQTDRGATVAGAGGSVGKGDHPKNDLMLQDVRILIVDDQEGTVLFLQGGSYHRWPSLLDPRAAESSVSSSVSGGYDECRDSELNMALSQSGRTAGPWQEDEHPSRSEAAADLSLAPIHLKGSAPTPIARCLTTWQPSGAYGDSLTTKQESYHGPAKPANFRYPESSRGRAMRRRHADRPARRSFGLPSSRAS